MIDQLPAPSLHELKAEVMARLAHCRELAEAHFSRRFPHPRVRWDLKGAAAGQVRFPRAGEPIVRFNLQLLEENGAAFIDRTVPHELAHVVTRSLFGDRARPHGREWQAVMALFGADASRCHDYDISRASTRRMQRFPYRCDCRRHLLTRIRKNRMAAGQIYHCRRCGGVLKPES